MKYGSAIQLIGNKYLEGATDAEEKWINLVWSHIKVTISHDQKRWKESSPKHHAEDNSLEYPGP